MNIKRIKVKSSVILASLVLGLNIITASAVGISKYNSKSIDTSQVYVISERQNEDNTIVVEEAIKDSEIDLITLITMAEAEGESEYGKRLVIDTILNRVDSEYFPNTITEVIYQVNAFESLWNGRVDRCYVDEDIRKLVLEEMDNRTNNDVVFFTAGRYSIYGAPMFQEGNHYFSSY